MANPTSPTDASGYRLGMMIHKVSTTLTACIWRAIGKASTSGATDVAWGGIATHLEDEVAVVADASNAKPVVLIAGQVGTHVTVATGDVSALQADALGALRINAGTSTAAALADAFANPTTTHLAADQMTFNGTTWGRQRGNVEGTLLSSSARTATVSSSDQTNYNGRGVIVFINVTSITSTPSVVFTVEVKDPISAVYTALLTSAAIVATGHTVLRLCPGITAAANVAVSEALPRTWRVTATHGDADSITYSVGYAVLA